MGDGDERVEQDGYGMQEYEQEQEIHQSEEDLMNEQIREI